MQDGPILVIGASGFVGRAVAARLVQSGRTVIGVARRSADGVVGVGHQPERVDWHSLVKGASAIIHAAGGKATDQDIAADALMARRLADAALRAGVPRIVLFSTVKVFGETSPRGQPFTEDSPTRPANAYGAGRLATERIMAGVLGERLTVLRLPIVYGRGAGGNFRLLCRLVASGLPLPFAGVENRRSMLGLQNLVAGLDRALEPEAPGGTFLLSDGEDLSTPELIRRIAGATGVPARLFALGEPLLRRLLQPVGKGALTRRLCDDLAVDISRARQVLGYTPRESVGQGLLRAFLRQDALPLEEAEAGSA